MLRRLLLAPLAILLLIAGLLAACTGQPQVTPILTIAPTRHSATSEPIVRRNPDQTPTVSSISESALVSIRQRGELRVGILYNYPPFGFLADNGEVHGYEAEMVRKIAERWGVEITFIQVTRQTRLPLLYDGAVDMLAAAMPHRRELEQFVEFSDTTYRSGYVVLVSMDSGIETIADIGTGAVAAVGPEAQALFTQYATQVGISPSVQVFNTLDDAMSAFKNVPGVSAIVGRREDMMLATTTLPNTEILNEFVAIEPYAFAVRRGDAPLRDLLNLTLQEIAGAGEFGELFTSNFYGYAADLFPAYPGEATYTYETFPTALPSTESLVERIKRGEALRVAGLDLSPQPGRFDGQPIIDGYNRAIVNEMARRWNVPVTELPQTVGDVGIGLLTSGQADLVVGIRPNLSLFGQVAFSQPYYQRGLRLIIMQGVTVLGISDLQYKPVIAAEPVASSEDLIKDNNGFPTIQTATSNEEAFQALISSGVFAVVGDEYAMMLMSQADSRIEVIGARYRPADYVMALPAYDPDFQALVNFTLQDMKLDGTLDRLRRQYFGPYAPADDPMQPFSLETWPGDGSFLGVGGF